MLRFVRLVRFVRLGLFVTLFLPWLGVVHWRESPPPRRYLVVIRLRGVFLSSEMILSAHYGTVAYAAPKEYRVKLYIAVGLPRSSSQNISMCDVTVGAV